MLNTVEEIVKKLNNNDKKARVLGVESLNALLTEASDETALTTAKTITNNLKLCGKTRFLTGFSSVAAFASNKKPKPSLVLLNHILQQGKLKGKHTYKVACLNGFKEMTDLDAATIRELYDKVTKGSVPCDEQEKNNFSTLLQSLDMPVGNPNPNDTLKNIEKHLNEANALFHALTNNLDKDKKIEELREQLRIALKMENVAKNSEIIGLKNDISEILRHDYSNFATSKEDPISEDLFKVYRSILSNVFKVLKRFDIPCE